MIRPLLLAVAGALCLATAPPASAAPACAPGPGPAACVALSATGFSPRQLAVPTGSSVYFVNASGAPAAVTVRDDGYTSGALVPGATSPPYRPSVGTHTATGYALGGVFTMTVSAHPAESAPASPVSTASNGTGPPAGRSPAPAGANLAPSPPLGSPAAVRGPLPAAGRPPSAAGHGVRVLRSRASARPGARASRRPASAGRPASSATGPIAAAGASLHDLGLAAAVAAVLLAGVGSGIFRALHAGLVPSPRWSVRARRPS